MSHSRHVWSEEPRGEKERRGRQDTRFFVSQEKQQSHTYFYPSRSPLAPTSCPISLAMLSKVVVFHSLMLRSADAVARILRLTLFRDAHWLLGLTQQLRM